MSTTFTDCVPTPGIGFSGPSSAVIPTSGKSPLFYRLSLTDDDGNPLDADAMPTVMAKFHGSDVSTNFAPAIHECVGSYRFDYQSSPSDGAGMLTVEADFTLSSVDKTATWYTILQNDTGQITPADRELLAEVFLGRAIFLTPCQAEAAGGPPKSSRLEGIAGLNTTYLLSCIDANGQAIDLSGKSTQFSVFSADVPSVAITTATGVVGGIGSSQVTVISNVAQAGEFRWALVNVTDSVLIGSGPIVLDAIPPTN